MEMYKRERIISNYDLLITNLNEQLTKKNSEKDKIIHQISKELDIYKREEVNMMQRKAFMKMFLKERFDASIEDLDEFVTEKKFDNRKKKK